MRLSFALNSLKESTEITNLHTQDMVSGDEIISDTWNLKEVDDIVYEVDCKKVTKGADQFGETSHLPTYRLFTCIGASTQGAEANTLPLNRARRSKPLSRRSRGGS